MAYPSIDNVDDFCGLGTGYMHHNPLSSVDDILFNKWCRLICLEKSPLSKSAATKELSKQSKYNPQVVTALVVNKSRLYMIHHTRSCAVDHIKSDIQALLNFYQEFGGLLN